MNVTFDQIKDLNSREANQMQRYCRQICKRISKRNRIARNQYEQEIDLGRKTNVSTRSNNSNNAPQFHR